MLNLLLRVLAMLLAGAAIWAASGCQGTLRPQSPSDGCLLAPVYFYPGYVVGDAAGRTSGLQCSRDDGASWESITWPEQISSSVAVDPSGSWVYVGCGNGVMVSADGGRTFRLTGGTILTEVQRVCIDSEDPERAWVATAYGVYATDDVSLRGDAWRESGFEQPFRFCSDVVQDVLDSNALWVASEVGLFFSRDRGRTFARRSPPMAVRRIVQRSAEELWLATDGEGLQRSVDGGVNWTRLDGSPDVCSAVALADNEVVLCGGRGQVLRSADAGRIWESGVGIESDAWVYDLESDPNRSNRWLAATSAGVYESVDNGATWAIAGLEGAVVRQVVVGRLANSALPSGLSADRGRLPARRNSISGRQVAGTPEFGSRLLSVRRALAARPLSLDAERVDFFHALAWVRSGRTGRELFEVIGRTLDKPQHSMFFSLPAVGFFLHCRDELDAELRERFREVLVANPVYRGDTENHWVMHFTALLLIAEAWPETRATEWYSGRTTTEIVAECEQWLDRWMRMTTSVGQGEFDSPAYLPMYLTPMLLLADFARDEGLRTRASMMVDLLLADYFTESLRGAWCGGHSRDREPDVFAGAGNRVAMYHWLYAGGIDQPESLHPWLAAGAWSSYVPLDVLSAIANDRDEPFEHHERKRVRNVMRYGAELNPPVYKTTYMTDVYGMGSLQGGWLQPIQQHTWDVTWTSQLPSPTLFTVHPQSSSRELGTFFPEDVHELVRLVDSTKSGYASADKWISSSSCERIWQRRNLLLALYDFPADERHREVSLFIPKSLERSDAEGWLFGRDGRFFVAVYACQPGSWEPAGESASRLRCTELDRAGFVVLADSTAAEDGVSIGRAFEQFRDRILNGSVPVLDSVEGQARLRYSAAGLDGPAELTFATPREVGPRPVFDGPFVRSAGQAGGAVLLTDGKRRRMLDFDAGALRNL